MPASEAQIRANRQNATRSTGPKTEAGKAASRANATRHGLAGESPDLEATRSPAFEARRVAWGERYGASGLVDDWALDRVVSASFRIERCEQAIETVLEETAERADFAWDQDQKARAAALGARLARDPSLAASQLESFRRGTELMIDWWTRLELSLLTGEEWTDEEAATALDLLGLPPHLRNGRTPIDPPDSALPVAEFRQKLARDEIARLEHLNRTALEPLDDLEHDRALSSNSALLGAPAKLVLRYEREAWRLYRESLKVLTDPSHATEETEPAPIPRPIAEPAPKPEPAPCPVAPSEAEEAAFHRMMMARAQAAMTGRPLGDDEMDEIDAYLDRVELLDGTNPIHPAELHRISVVRSGA